MSLDSRLRPEDKDKNYKAPTENNPSLSQRFFTSLMGHGSVAGLGASLGGIYGIYVWENGGSAVDVKSGMFHGALATGLFSIAFFKYRGREK